MKKLVLILGLAIISACMLPVHSLENQFSNKHDYQYLDITQKYCSKKYIPASDKEVRFCGILNENSYNFFSKLDIRDRSIYFTSSGGEVDWAIKFSELFNESRARLIIDGPCTSACADVIFLAADRVSIRPNALIGFHHSVFTMVIRGSRDGMLTKKEVENTIERHVKPLQNYYLSKGIDTRMLFEADLKNLPICVNKKVRRDLHSLPKIRYENTYAFWVPGSEALRTLNARAHLELTNSDILKNISNFSLLSEIPEKYFKFGEIFTFEYDLEDALKLMRLPYC